MSAAWMDLAEAALDRVARLADDDAKEGALREIGRALSAFEGEPERVVAAYRRILELGGELSRANGRMRSRGEACQAIASARVPRPMRGELLEHALEIASTSGESAERIDRARVAIESMIELHWGDEVGEELAALADSAAALSDERERTRATSLLALALAHASDCDRALEVLDRLPASGERARCLALIGAKIYDTDRSEDAAAIMDRALAEARSAPPSSDQAFALRTLLEVLIETAMETPSGDALGAALDGIDEMHDDLPKREALTGALEAIPTSSLEPSRLFVFIARIGLSIDRVEAAHARGALLGKLAVTLAAIGDVDGCEQVLQKVVALADRSVDIDLVDTFGDLPAAIPLPEIVNALAEAEVPEERLYAFALTALELIRTIGDATSLGMLLRQFARLFASPALAYERRVMILEKALEVARTIAPPDERVQVATAIANALSLAGAMERGDAFFAGLVTGADAKLARAAHQERAVVLVRMNRTADALSELAAAARTPGADSWHGVQGLARTAARCGFVADALAELQRVEPDRQSEAHAQLADTFAEATWIDPNLRVIGLESLAKTADPPAAETIACLLAQVRLLEGIGDAKDVLARAFERTTSLENRSTAAIFEQQLVGAAIARMQRTATSA